MSPYAGIYFVKTGSIEGELRLNEAAAIQNCLENTKAFLWEYRTSINGTVSSRMIFREYFETIGRFGFFK